MTRLPYILFIDIPLHQYVRGSACYPSLFNVVLSFLLTRSCAKPSGLGVSSAQADILWHGDHSLCNSDGMQLICGRSRTGGC